MSDFFDIVFVADPRFPGGTSTALAAEVQAAARAGLSAALLPVMSPILRQSRPVHKGLADKIEETGTQVLDRGRRVRSLFAIVHHPSLFEGLPQSGLRLRAETVVLVLHHPLRDGTGSVQYDLPRVIEHIELALGATPVLAPVGPLVRAQIPRDGVAGAQLTAQDWWNLIDPEDWPARPDRPVGTPIRIGRHSRPLAQKFPGDLALARAAYPDRPDFEIDMLGADPECLRRSLGEVPAHWHLRPFGSEAVSDYLRSLDFYVYFHRPDWIEAFGRAILEAAVSGLVVILPHHFRPLFGPAAIYGSEADVVPMIEEMVADPARYEMQGKRARAYAAHKFRLENFAVRLKALNPSWAALRPAQPKLAPRPARTAQTALFMTSNGVGLGHLTRMLAVADRMPAEVKPVFFTLSRAAGLVHEAGYSVEYRPFHRDTGIDIDTWNNALATELAQVIAFYDPAVFVFDGNVPYTGLCDALAAAPDLVTVWMRRAFWSDTHGKMLARAHHFDAVIEPGNLAERLDRGPTVPQRNNVHLVPPVLRADPDARLERRAARRLLGLPEDGTLALVSLGAQTNYDVSDVLRALLDWQVARPAVTLVHLTSWIGRHAELPGNALRIAQYPVFPYTRAFDFQVSACGYNAFHEAMLGTIPTVFVPNEAGEMDLQTERARFGELAGASLTLRRAEALGAHRILDRILQPEVRSEMREAAKRIARAGGAEAAARFICDYARLRKLHIPI